MNFKVSQLKSLTAGEVAVDDLIYVIDSNPTDGSVKSKKVTVGDLIDSRIYGISSSQFVLITGYYADPSWITSLDWSKITNAPSFVTSLSALTDVQLSTPLSGQALVYNGTKWVNQGIGELDTLATVTTRGNTTTNAITVGGATVNTTVNSGGIILQQNGTNIGEFRRVGNNNRGALYLINSGTTEILLETGGFSYIRSNGFGIGTATDAGYKLDVSGSFRASGAIRTDATGYAISLPGLAANSGIFINSTNASLVYNTDSQITWGGNGVTIASGPGRIKLSNYSNNGVVIYNQAGSGAAYYALTVNNTTTIATTGYQVGVLAGSLPPIIELYNASSSLIYGFNTTDFRSSMPVVIGSQSAPIGKLQVTGSITAASLLAQGVFFNNTLVAAANNDVLVGLDINPTFTNGAFTGVSNFAARFGGNVIFTEGVKTISIAAPATTGNGGALTISAGNATTLGQGGNISLQPGNGAGGPGAGTVIISNTSWWNGATVNGTLTVTNSGPNTGTSLQVNAGGQNGLTIYWDNLTPFMQYGLVSGRQARFVNSSSYSFSNNVLINTTTSSTHKLDVVGSTRIAESTAGTKLTVTGIDQEDVLLVNWAGTNSIGLGSNTANNPVLRLGVIRFTAHPNGGRLQLSGATGRFGTDTELKLYGSVSGTATGTMVWLGSNSDFSAAGHNPTSGTLNVVGVLQKAGPLYAAFNPALGNATFNIFNVDPVINTSGTYAGIVRGFYYNPTLTSVTGVTHRAIETTSGDVLFAGNGPKLIFQETTAALNTPSTTSIFFGASTTPGYGAGIFAVGGAGYNRANIVIASGGATDSSNVTTANANFVANPGGTDIYKNTTIYASNLTFRTATLNTGTLSMYWSHAETKVGLFSSCLGSYGRGDFRIGILNSADSVTVSTTDTRFMVTGDTYNVLIGTTTDSGYRLDVNGTARFSNTIYTNFATSATITAVLARGFSDSSFQLVTENGGSVSGWGISTTFGMIYSGVGDVAKLNFHRGTGTGTGFISFNSPLKIGDTSATAPAAQFTIKGSGSTSATNSFLITNSSGSNALKIADDALSFYYGIFGVGQNHYYSNNGSGARRWSDSYSIIDYTRSYGDSYLVYGGSSANYIFDLKDGFWSKVRYPLCVSTTFTNPNASAILQADSTTQGFLAPRLTTSQILAIASPAEGLQVYNTDLKTICFYNGTAWQRVTSTAM